MAPSPLLSDPFILAAVALVLVTPAVFLLRRGRKPWLSRVRRKPLLTGNEAEFFYRLQRALPGFHVFPQVSFAAFLTDDGQLSRNAKWAVRSRFDRKIADFVICERGTLKVVALVELDDRLHDAKADRQRDVITKAAGYQTIRYQSRQKPSEAEIAALFQHARAWAKP
jgi:very-short-patch-repair endonuclease